ncbi:hypothetical protein JTB14_035923 [Gonioctena quinquepunctata]|nr:hypothetical protein JTB14_035923 [Gonioctena quinquepunctata]
MFYPADFSENKNFSDLAGELAKHKVNNFNNGVILKTEDHSECNDDPLTNNFSSESEARFGVKMSLPVENRHSTAALEGIAVLYLIKRALKYFCTKCRDNDLTVCLKNMMRDKETIIEDKITIIKMLQDKVMNLQETKTYASVAAVTKDITQITMTKQQPKNLPVVIVKPNKPQNAELTKSEIQTKINPRALQVSINSVKTGYNGNLIIKCNSQKEAVKLIEEAQKQDLSNKYQIQMSQLKKPRIKIITTNNNMDKEEIEECLRSQNECVTPEDYLKVTFIKNVTNGKVTVCAECSAPLFKKFMDNKKVFISWERCPVYEDLTISRCKICNDFDHKDKYCKNKITCMYCGDEHKIDDCPKQLKKCCNCLRANKNIS